ncbi:MAG TPA: serine hydrolase domain-containing protein, partial [Haliangium sp.]|nr:serine hydrolase domain-containing protein [Haliangium sp.]
MRLSKSILVSCGLLCLGSSALAQPIPWQDQIAVYDLNTFGIHLPYFRSGTTFYDVHLDHLSNGPYTATLGNYGLSAPGTPDPAYYAVLSGSVLYVPVLEVGDLYYEAYFTVINYSPYTFRISTLVQIDEPEPDPPASACGFVPQTDPKLAGLMSRMQGKLSTSLSVQGKPSGAILAVVKDGQLISAEGLGTRSKATYGKDNQPVNRETRFWVASTSKFMTAAGAMTLVDDGLLNLM